MAGTRCSMRGSISSARMPSRAAMKRFSSSTSGSRSSLSETQPSSISSFAMHCTSATIAAVSATVDCTSMIRTSTVPKRGCGRTSHQR